MGGCVSLALLGLVYIALPRVLAVVNGIDLRPIRNELENMGPIKKKGYDPRHIHACRGIVDVWMDAQYLGLPPGALSAAMVS